MPGDGTKLATTTDKPAPPARLLDLTRLISRTGRTLTGVDRVERAYLRHLIRAPIPLFGLVRTTFGYILLDETGLSALLDRIDGRLRWGPLDTLSSLRRKKPEAVRRAEADLRRFALDRCRPRNLTKMLGAHLPKGVAYLNVGHSNLTDRVLWAVRHGPQGWVCVFVHDTIPLDFPQFQRDGTVDRFRAFLRRARTNADLLIYNSVHTEMSVNSYMAEYGIVPPGVVAPLGVDLPDLEPPPAGIDLTPPYFVTVGTIEPRKNHSFLLDVWDVLEPPVPRLFICGARGWKNEALFARLDRLQGDKVVECPDLTDGALAALIWGSSGLLFPSLAEGYGLPPIEAAALGVPVLCNDLPIYQETLGNIPVYAPVSDRYLWKTRINQLALRPIGARDNKMENRFVAPDWDTHFNIILRMT